MTYDALGNLLTVDGPLSGTADTTRYRYNAARQVVGVVSPDPDGAGAMKNRAVRNSYTNGLLTKVEQGTVNSQSDTDWSAFSSLQEVDTAYDANARPVTQSLVSGGTTYALTQTSYDSLGRVQCVAQRMNPSVYGSLPSDACTLGTSGSYGSDRIVKTTYDAAGQVTKVTSAYGTTDQADDVTSTYTNNGKVQTVTDAENNKTTYVYDGLDRLYQTQYPSSTKGSGTSNSSDYEQLGYDANGNRTSFRNRANETISFSYDALNRMTAKTLPNSEPSVSYAYDLLGRMTSAATSAQTLSFTYDALGRNLTQAGPQGTVTSSWDTGGRRTRITHPDGFYVDQDYLTTGELQKIRENGATSGVGVLATYAYDDLGRRTSLTFGNGNSTFYSYDAVSRLSQLSHDMSGTSYDQTLSFSYNPASDITSNTRSNDVYAWLGHGNGSTSSTANGLNQLTAIGGGATSHDSRGNMTADGLGHTFGYSSENLLTSGPNSTSVSYDPAMRLYQVSGASTTRFGYDGQNLIDEYNGSNSLQRRFVFGPGTDEPIVWYEGSGTADRRFLQADERGSVVAVSNSSGTVTNVDTYDEYGKPASANVGRFQYTGQKWIAELGLYDYKARMYHPSLGRFMQTDPIGYGDGMSMYAYVRANPVNRADPSGMQTGDDEASIVCTCPSPPANHSLIGDHSFDWMGINGQAAGGRLEAMQFERLQAELQAAMLKLNGISNSTGIGVECLLSQSCTDTVVAQRGSIPSAFAVFAGPTNYGMGLESWGYQLVDQNGNPIYSDAYRVKEFVTTVEGNFPSTETNYIRLDRFGEIWDKIGFNPQPVGDADWPYIQTFRVIDNNGTSYPISTIFWHELILSRGVFHSTTVTLPPLVPIPF